MRADDRTGVLYVGDELRGIWRLGAEPQSGDTRELIVKVDGVDLVADIEGLTLAPEARTAGISLPPCKATIATLSSHCPTRSWPAASASSPTARRTSMKYRDRWHRPDGWRLRAPVPGWDLCRSGRCESWFRAELQICLVDRRSRRFEAWSIVVVRRGGRAAVLNPSTDGADFLELSTRALSSAPFVWRSSS